MLKEQIIFLEKTTFKDLIFLNRSRVLLCLELVPPVIFVLQIDTVSGLSDCNGTRTHYHLVRKQTLNHLAKLTK